MTAPLKAKRMAVFASGGGSNMEALYSYFFKQGSAASAQICLLITDKLSAGAVEKAKSWNIPFHVLTDFGDGNAISGILEEHQIELIVLAGYLKLLPPQIVSRWSGQIVNIHPSLLPAFGGRGMYGTNVHKAVSESGARITGVTIHFVDEAYDRGPIAAQWPVPVYANDSTKDIAERVLKTEHLLLPATVDAIASGRLYVNPDGSVFGSIDLSAMPVFSF